jgi:hypothetical protein
LYSIVISLTQQSRRFVKGFKNSIFTINYGVFVFDYLGRCFRMVGVRLPGLRRAICLVIVPPANQPKYYRALPFKRIQSFGSYVDSAVAVIATHQKRYYAPAKAAYTGCPG